MGKTNEPSHPTLAEIRGTDTEAVLLLFAKGKINHGYQKVLLRNIEFSGEWFRLEGRNFWERADKEKVYHIFPVTYEPPSLEPKKWDGADDRPWWKRVFGK